MSVHLAKVLRHAEAKLVANAQKNPTDFLDLYRPFLKVEEHRLFLGHRSGDEGKVFVRKRTDLMDVVLRHIWSTSIQSASRAHSIIFDPDSLAMIAVGGFGRGELCPYSDVDLLFLYKKKMKGDPLSRMLQDIIEQILYVLWDIGFKVGHASRSLDEAIEEANTELKTKTSLLESHLISGSANVHKAFEEMFQKQCIKGKEAAYLEWRHIDQTERHTKQGGTVFVQEPNVKNGCGGLRDYHNLLWVARMSHGLRTTLQIQEAGWLTAMERNRIEKAYDFILHVRNELHYQQKRPGDVLTLKLQGTVSKALQYGQKNVLRRIEAFMRDYYQHARDIYQICNLTARRLSTPSREEKKTAWSFLPLKKKERKEIDGFILEEKQLYASENNIFTQDSLRLLRVFQIMQQYDATLSPELEQLIRSKLHLASRRFLWLPEMQEMFTSIFRKKGKVGRILRSMHETGILGRVVPEFAPLTCLVQHEFFHVYTADEHTIVCLEMLDRVIDSKTLPFPKYRPIFLDCDNPEILYTALLLHDVGKATPSRHHSELSAQAATRFARRMKLKGRDFQNLIFLVDHHMTLSEFAQRRNVEDAETIREFARIVQDQERLDMLMLMTFADGQATGTNHNWSGWKELLVWQLYLRTCEMLKGEEEFAKNTQVKKEQLIAGVSHLLPAEIAQDELAAHFNLLPERYMICTPEYLIAHHVELIHDFFVLQVLQGENVLRPIVKWIDHEAEGYSGVIVVTWNRDRLFGRIAGAFAVADLNILSADVFTRSDDIVVDTFRVCTPRFDAVLNKIDQRKFEHTLAESLMEPNYDFAKQLVPKTKGVKDELDDAEFPSRLILDNETSDAQTLLHVQTPDRPGLLYRLTSCLSDHRLSIYNARITTEKGAALDTFYLTDRKGQKILDPEEHERLLADLQKQVTRPPSV